MECRYKKIIISSPLNKHSRIQRITYWQEAL